MEMRNCRRCGKLFGYVDKPICQDCLRQDEDDFKIVKEYIYDHPRCALSEVSTVTGVSVKKITKFLKDGRLEVIEGMVEMLDCEKCGTPIKTGRLCNDCSGQFSRDIGAAKRDASQKSSGDEIEAAKKNAQMHLKHHVKRN